MHTFRDLLAASQPLLMFVVVGLGYMLGHMRVKGFALGMSGVLFVGLFFGAWKSGDQEALKLAPQITEVGLILFVYAVGLTTGPGFFTSMRQNGIRFNAAVVVALAAGAVLTVGLGRVMHMSQPMIAGAYAGALMNMPSLAAVTQLLKVTNPGAEMEPTLGFSLAYPMGMLGSLLALQALILINKLAFAEERQALAAATHSSRKLSNGNFEITNPAIMDKTIGELRVQDRVGVRISRIRHGDEILVPSKYTQLQRGDVVVVVGAQERLAEAREFFGADSAEHLELNRERIEMRRVLVSNKKLVGRSIEELELDSRFQGQITRVRRADLDMVAHPEMVLELGDRLRVVAPREKIGELSAYFGDSERERAELDYTAITLGISLGVLIGMIPIPVPGAGTVSLGFAGGPLVVALILGKLGRTGPIVWSIPLEANLTLRHIGLLMFLAGVGVLAGSRFLEAVQSNGWQLLFLGFVSIMFTTSLLMWLLRSWAKARITDVMGACSGMQTQPATLAVARDLCRSDEVYVAYATTYPVAMIGKIIIAQLIVVLAG